MAAAAAVLHTEGLISMIVVRVLTPQVPQELGTDESYALKVTNHLLYPGVRGECWPWFK